MLLITDLSQIQTPFASSVVTLGNFDGIHIGHQELIRMVISRARAIGGTSVVVTFRPHPLKILAPDRCPPLISIYEEKIRLIEQLGIDVLVKIPFSLEFAKMTPRDFAGNVLAHLLGSKEIFVGYNYRFGKGREGNIETLRKFGKEFGFTVREVEQISLGSEEISSTRIRQFLREGRVADASRLLGRTYAITGVVSRGDGRGRTLGFPTANIAPKHTIIPSNGVYAVRVLVREKTYNGIVNIGMRPTFNTNRLAIEVHLFDFDEDIYGEEITVYFVHKIREETKFVSAAELQQQIAKDISGAHTILAAS